VNLDLSLLAYGTLIPDLRTVLYQQDRSESFNHIVYEVDRFLQDWTEPRKVPPGVERLKEWYDPIGPDRELTQLICDANDVGATVGIYLNPGILTSRSCREMVDKFTDQLPSCARVIPGSAGDSLYETVSGIIVARQLEVVAQAIDQGYQAILYESADRLRRELELRGYYIPVRRHTTNSHAEVRGWDDIR
jgi:hypothetical protein